MLSTQCRHRLGIRRRYSADQRCVQPQRVAVRVGRHLPVCDFGKGLWRGLGVSESHVSQRRLVEQKPHKVAAKRELVLKNPTEINIVELHDCCQGNSVPPDRRRPRCQAPFITNGDTATVVWHV